MISVNQEIGTSFPENRRRERDMMFLIEGRMRPLNGAVEMFK